MGFFLFISVAYFIIKCEQKIPDMKETVCVIYISKIYIYYKYLITITYFTIIIITIKK